MYIFSTITNGAPFKGKILDVPKMWQNEKLQQKITTDTVE
jgi:hypothetical protein